MTYASGNVYEGDWDKVIHRFDSTRHFCAEFVPSPLTYHLVTGSERHDKRCRISAVPSLAAEITYRVLGMTRYYYIDIIVGIYGYPREENNLTILRCAWSP